MESCESRASVIICCDSCHLWRSRWQLVEGCFLRDLANVLALDDRHINPGIRILAYPDISGVLLFPQSSLDHAKEHQHQKR
jgi:hypothetical protein